MPALTDILLKLKYQANRGKSKQCRAANVKCCKLHSLADRLTALLCLGRDRRQQDSRKTGDRWTDAKRRKDQHTVLKTKTEAPALRLTDSLTL